MAPHDFGCACARHVARPWARPEHWSKADVAYLDSTFGRISDAAISRHLGRTITGIQLKAKRSGLHKRDAGMTSREVEQIFGLVVGDGRVSKRWITGGMLRARRGHPVGSGGRRVWIIAEDDLLTFIRSHPEEIDVDRMPESVYRDAATADPWVSLPEVHRLTGRSPHFIAADIRAGVIEGRRRGARWYIPVREIARIRHLSPEARAESWFRRQSTLSVRRNRRKGLAA